MIRVSLFWVLLMCCVNSGVAQWPTTPAEDLQIAYNSTTIKLVLGENSGVWVQMGGGQLPNYYYQTFLQRVDPWGFTVFDTSVGVQGPEDNHAGAAMASDGMAGLYLAYHTAEWINYPHSHNYTLRLQHYDSTGTPLWPYNGIEIVAMDSVTYGSQCSVVSDDSGGVIVVWTDRREPLESQNYDLFAQRYSESGQTLWDGNIVVTTRNQLPLQAVSDQEGGVIIQGGYWFYRLDSQGNAVWDSLGIQAPIWIDEILSDRKGGLVGIGRTSYGTQTFPYFDYALVVNRLTAAGEWMWGNDGITLSDTLIIEHPGRLNYLLTSLEEAGTIAAWVKGGPTNDGIWIQRLDTTGQVMFPPGGKRLISDSTSVLWELLPSTAQSVVCLFSSPNRNVGTYAQRIDTLGQPMWGDSAVLVSTRDQGVLDAVSDGQGGAVVATGTNYLKQISANGNLGEVITTTFPESPAPLPKQTRLSPAYPNPFNASVAIPYTLRRPSTVTITVYDLCGILVTELYQGSQAPGQYQVQWDGTASHQRMVSSGIYFIRAQLADQMYTRKVVLLK